MATWTEFIAECAGRLARVKSMKEFDQELDRIERQITQSPHPAGNKKFWELLREKYKEDPKYFIKEAMSAESLNELVAAAVAALKQKAGQ